MFGSALTRGRTLARRLMTDTCTITRAGAGGPVFDPEIGEYTDPNPTTVYTGACRVQLRGTVGAQQAPHGGQVVDFHDVEVWIPIDATDIQIGDLVTITAAASDPTLPDQRYWVHGLHAKSQATARRLLCERTGPAESDGSSS